MKIAILGYGVVGSGIVELIQRKQTQEMAELSVGAILVKDRNDPRWQTIRKQVLVTDSFAEIIADASIACIVEVMGGIDPAYAYIKQTLKAKRHVVSANKAVLAEHLSEFAMLAQKNQVQLLFEASVGGGMPWLKSIQDVKRVDSVKCILGILNGTTNYMLDQMSRLQITFAQALTQAQALGYAEADPSADIDGIDIQRKLLISAALAWDIPITLDQIAVRGIRDITSTQIAYYKTINSTIKLLAEGMQYANGYQFRVEPVLVQENSVMGQIHSNLNWGLVAGDSIGELQFIGQGAGKEATANAVVQNILDIKKQIHRPLVSLKESITALVEQENEYMLFAENFASAAAVEQEMPALLTEKEEYGAASFYRTKAVAASVLQQRLLAIEKQGIAVSYVRLFRQGEQFMKQKKGILV